jgi:protein tyrosine/serine phosphatase
MAIMHPISRSRTALSTTALVLCLSGGIVSAAPADSPNAAEASALSAIRIDNFGRINANYYRGGQPEGPDYAALKALGVKTVINLTSDDAEATEPALVQQAGMRYVAIPMTTHEVPTSAQLAQFLALVNDPASQPVYVHCVGGKHRTGVMTAAYRMTNDGWTADQAFKEMKQYKFGADFLHSEFKGFVYDYNPADYKPAASETRVASASGVEPRGAGVAATSVPATIAASGR